jgi:hypothetical protein
LIYLLNYSVDHIWKTRTHAVPSSPVCRISGEVAEGSDTLLLRIETEDDASDFRLARSDLGALVNMLLALASVETQPNLDLADGTGSPPLPAASLSLGETAEGQALLGIEVGAVKLAFGIPQNAAVQLAYAILAATADIRSAT